MAILWFALLGPTFAAAIDELKLPDGTVYRHARIISIQGDTVSIVHEQGLVEIPASTFDLETLARAQMEIDAKAAEKQNLAAQLATKDAKERALTEGGIQGQKTAAANPLMKVAPALVVAEKRLQTTAPPISEAQRRLDNLKVEFPASIAGPVTDRTDPLIRNEWNKWKRNIDNLTLENLPANLGLYREALDREIGIADAAFENGKRENSPNIATPSMRRAQLQNREWLKFKLRPYLLRLESFQRSRPQS